MWSLCICNSKLSVKFPYFVESRNPKFTSTNDSGKVICGERAVIETNQSEEVEMEETEASRTANTPKMPEVQGEVSSACSTPGLPLSSTRSIIVFYMPVKDVPYYCYCN